jgi:hypothetical protein
LLLRILQGGQISWREIARRYRAEMFAPAATDAGNANGAEISARLKTQPAAVRPHAPRPVFFGVTNGV